MSVANLLKLNVNEHTEKKGNLTYLSWAWAWAEALKADPEVVYDVAVFDGKPYMDVNGTAMVFVSVKMFNITRTCQLPVMDFRNKAIPKPDAFAVNTAIMRCMTKCLSLFGLGLYIYSGEDLPEDAPKTISATKGAFVDDKQVSQMHDVADAINEHFSRDDIIGAYEEAIQVTDSEEKTYLWSLLDSKVRSALKKHGESIKGN
jgi:hypothetical protein